MITKRLEVGKSRRSWNGSYKKSLRRRVEVGGIVSGF